MIKLVYCLKRRGGMSLEEFQHYWLTQHGPLVRGHAGALGIKRYVQVHTAPLPINDVLRGSRNAPEGFDGVAELWWESLDALAEALATPEGAKAGQELLEDERNFIDHERSPVWLAEEHELVS